MDDVTVVHDIFLAFVAALAGFLGADFALVGDVVVVGDGEGADEAAFEIRVDDAGSLGALVPRTMSRRGIPSGRR